MDETAKARDVSISSSEYDLEAGNSDTLRRAAGEVDELHKWSWLNPAYHSLVTILGTGILGFPYAFSLQTWAGGTIFLVLVTVVSYYTARILVNLQEPGQQSYSDVMDAVFGARFSRLWVKPFQLLGFFPTCSILILIGGNGLYQLDQLHGQGTDMRRKNWTAIMGAIVFLCALPHDLSHSWYISMIGSVAAIVISFYGVIGSGLSMARSDEEVVYRASENAFDIMISFGSILFGYGYHALLPNIQHAACQCDEETYKDYEHSNHTAAVVKATKVVFAFVFAAYSSVAMVGFGAFGVDVESNVLDSIAPFVNAGAMIVIWISVVFKTASEAAAFNQAAFAVVNEIFRPHKLPIPTETDDESGVQQQDASDVDEDKSGTLKRTAIELIFRFCWTTTATVLAVSVPIFADLTAVCGAVAAVPLTFILPLFCWNRKLGDSAPTWRRRVHDAIIALFFGLGVLALIGAIYDVVQNA